MIMVWWDTKETRTRYNGGEFCCPHCGENCASTITGYRNVISIWNIPLLGAKMTWRRVCSACGQSDSITKEEAKRAAVENNEWRAYCKAIKIPGLLVLGLFLAIIGALFLYIVVEPVWEPVYRAEDTELSTLASDTCVTFDMLYLLDYYGYETDDDTNAVTSYSFLAYYYSMDDASPCFLSLRITSGDELFGTVKTALDANGSYNGDLSGPAYCSVSDFNAEMQSYYERSIGDVSTNVELKNTGKNLEYLSSEKSEFNPVDLIYGLIFLIPGLALIVGYCCKNNPKHPPELRSI